MHQLNDRTKLLELLTAGVTIFTPNNRLSAALLQQYFAYRQCVSIEKPRCLPYRTALINAYQRLSFLCPNSEHPLLFDAKQIQYLWRTLIKAQNTITFSEGLLHAVIEAWSHCMQWQIPIDHPQFATTPQTRQFQRWWQQFSHELNQLNAISEEQLLPYLLQHAEKLWTTPIVWACFDDYTPQQLLLQSTLSQKGLEQYHYDLAASTTTPQVFAAPNSQEEYQQLIVWLQSKIAAQEERIGVVVPNLQQESRSLARILGEHFTPEEYDISLGQKLSEFPLVNHALAWLSLDQHHCSDELAALLLQSPYLGAAQEEFIQRSQVLQDSSLLSTRHIALNQLIRDLRLTAPKLAEILNTIQPYPPSASIAQWVQLFHRRLNDMGFPGDYSLNSTSYQCYHRFLSIFDEFQQLSLLSPILSAEEAFDTLNTLIQSTIFQAQKSKAPIQISGLLEASGCEFDSLWVCGLTDQCLPQKIRLSAFIPQSLQQELKMPHSSPDRELVLARQTLQRLQGGSQRELVLSYAKLSGDSPNLPSSLILGFPAYTPLPLPSQEDKPLALIALDEDYLIALNPTESLTGGTALLGNQAKCPFKAFAQHRLSAKPCPIIAEGIDSKEKGMMIHKVMELLWLSLGNQDRLNSLDNATLHQAVDAAILQAINPLHKRDPDALPNLITVIESTRLKRLVLACLEWEKQRPSFSVVAVEEDYTINLAGLAIKVRVDRLDQVGDSQWVIDYKSSLPTTNPWYEDRPQEPQLLLYALLAEEINTLLFLQVRTGKIQASGLSQDKVALSGIRPLKKEETWAGARATWLKQLTQLATEIQQGHCPPLPTNTAICQHCEFKNLCRIP